MLYGVGAFSRVVGVSDYDSYPPDVAKLPHLGTLNNPNLERITALRPDLVMVNKAQAPFIEDTLHALGLHIFTVSNQSVAEVYSAITAIGRSTGNEAEAARLAAATREGIDRVARRTARLSKLRVVLIVDRTPGTLRDLYTATAGGYLAELVELAGGHIVTHPVPAGYAKLDKEQLLALNPDVILDFMQGPRSRFAGDPLEAWREMPELKAVREHKVYSVDEDFVPHASQRMVQTVELFARLIHPESK